MSPIKSSTGNAIPTLEARPSSCMEFLKVNAEAAKIEIRTGRYD